MLNISGCQISSFVLLYTHFILESLKVSVQTLLTSLKIREHKIDHSTEQIDVNGKHGKGDFILVFYDAITCFSEFQVIHGIWAFQETCS